jgi:hypothetical protein
MSGHNPRVKHAAVFIATIAIITLFLSSNSAAHKTSKEIYNIDSNEEIIELLKESAAPTTIDLASAQIYENLPVAHVQTSTVDDSWAQVIFFPQYHRYPGSEIKDAKNDRALAVQKETYQILEHILSILPVDLIMIEGEMNGLVPSEKKENIKRKIQIAENLETGLKNLKTLVAQNPLDNQLQRKTFDSGEKFLAELQREIYLEGAPYVVYSKNEKITLYGSENLETIEKSRNLVRNHLYLQDQIASIKNSYIVQDIKRPTTTLHDQQASINNLKLLQLLKTGNDDPHENLHNALDKLKVTAKKQNNSEVLIEIEKLLETCEMFMESERKGVVKANFANNNTPSRADNPYKNIVDEQQLISLLKQNEQEIDEIVVNQRNKELAENFANLLKTNGETIGILQFGAGHQEGLIKEFNKLGISVITVTTSKVAKY